MDVCDDQAIAGMVDKIIEKFGGIDILVNNAGISFMNRTTGISRDEWNRVIGTNLTSVFVLSRAVGEKMIGNKSGNIINIASVFCKMVSNRSLHYCTLQGGDHSYDQSPGA